MAVRLPAGSVDIHILPQRCERPHLEQPRKSPPAMSVSTKNHEMTLRMLPGAIQDSIAHRFAG